MARLALVRPINLRQQVVDEIRTAIIEGRLTPGDHIAEAQLTGELGVSRTPIREALILLEGEGLIVAVPNRGCFVRAFSEQDVTNIFSMRTALENFAAEQNISGMGAANYTHLRDLIKQQEQAIDLNDFRRVRSIDMSFHRFLVEKSDHTLLIRQWSELVAQIAAVLYTRANAINNYDEYQSIRDHTNIVTVYEQRDLGGLRLLNAQINERVAAECRVGVAQRINGSIKGSGANFG